MRLKLQVKQEVRRISDAELYKIKEIITDEIDRRIENDNRANGVLPV